MKLSTCLICFMLCLSADVVFGQTNACGHTIIIISEEQYSDWQLPRVAVLQDSFNGPTLNEDLWGFGFPWGKILTIDANEGMAEENLRFENGSAILTTEYRPREFDTFVFENGELVGTVPVLKDYSSAAIFSRMQFTHGEFYLEYEIEALSAQWPAFWLLGDCQQEIDIFEYFYGSSIFHDNWTKEITYTVHQDDNCADPEKCRIIKTKFLDNDFYKNTLYAKLNWQNYRLQLFRDRNEEPDWVLYRWLDMSYRPLSQPDKGSIVRQSRYFPFDIPMRVMIGQGVHGTIKEKMKAGAKEFKLHEVKVLQAIEPNGKVRVNADLITKADYDGIITGGSIELGAAPYFNRWDYLLVKAAQGIDLQAGFDSNGGRSLDLDAVSESELVPPNGDSAPIMEAPKIISYSMFDAVGRPLIKSQSTEAELFEIEELIRTELEFHAQKGLIIFRFELSDGGFKSRKIYLL